MYFLEKEYRKNKKKQLANYIFSLYKKMKPEKYSDDLCHFIIKSWHMNCPLYTLVVIGFFPYIYALISYLLVVCVLCMFIYLDGCFLSVTEYKIKNIDINIADPLIMLFNADINHKNRFKYSIYTISMYMIIVTGIMLYRFWL